MKTARTIFLCIAAAAAGTGLGWLLRGGEAPAFSGMAGTSSKSTQPGEGVLTQPGKPPSRPAARDQSSGKAPATSHPDAVRWLTVLGVAEDAPPAELARHILAARGLPGAVRLIASRWAQQDSRHLYDTLRAGHALARDLDVCGVLMHRWVKQDRAAALAAMDDAIALPAANHHRANIAGELMANDPAVGLRQMSKWKLAGFIPASAGIQTWASRDPQAAATAIIEARIGDAGIELIRAVGAKWNDPAAALTFAGQTGGDPGYALAEAAAERWAERDAAAARANISALTDPALRRHLLRKLTGAEKNE